MEMVSTQENGVLVAQAWLRVDGTNARGFEESLRKSVQEGDQGMLVDCKDLKYISSAGLRAILLTAKMLKKRKMEFAICNLTDSIRDIFQISGFDKIIAIYDSKADALAALGS